MTGTQDYIDSPVHQEYIHIMGLFFLIHIFAMVAKLIYPASAKVAGITITVNGCWELKGVTHTCAHTHTHSVSHTR